MRRSASTRRVREGRCAPTRESGARACGPNPPLTISRAVVGAPLRVATGDRLDDETPTLMRSGFPPIRVVLLRPVALLVRECPTYVQQNSAGSCRRRSRFCLVEKHRLRGGIQFTGGPAGRSRSGASTRLGVLGLWIASPGSSLFVSVDESLARDEDGDGVEPPEQDVDHETMAGADERECHCEWVQRQQPSPTSCALPEEQHDQDRVRAWSDGIAGTGSANDWCLKRHWTRWQADVCPHLVGDLGGGR